MNNYIVYFQIGGHFMKMKVTAQTEDSAKESVKKKIVFHKVEQSVLSSDYIDQLSKQFADLLK